jgi:predicted Zn-dependent peptidase
MHKTICGYPFLFIRDPSKVIHIEAIIHSGFVHENKHNSGINHLLEHALTDGWKKCTETCITYWDKHGGLMNASTDNTMMKYYIKGDKKDTPNMVEFIATIATKSLFKQTTLEREKKAVVEELTDLLDDPLQEMYNVFHKAFYKTEGLQHAEDCKLQIKNIKHLTLADIQKTYLSFNPENMFFIVYGDYEPSIVGLFEKHLLKHPGKKWHIENCFTFTHDILFTKYDKESTSLMLGFPSSKKSFFLPYVQTLLHHLLFYELRTKHQYIYDLDVKCTPNECGVVTEIEINVQNKNVVAAFDILLESIRRYQTVLVSKEYIEGTQQAMHYTYHTTHDFVEYYSLYEPLTKRQMIEKRKEFTAPLFRTLCRELCPIEKALCVYQSKQKQPFSWN